MNTTLESYVHGVFMRGQKIGAAVMPYRWPRIFEGDEPALDLCRHMLNRKHRSIFFVTSKTPVRTGLIDPLVACLREGGVRVAVYDDIRPDPSIDDIEVAVAELKKQGCDAVLALGGGSVIDAAKVIAARARNNKPILKMTGMFRVSKGMLPLYAVPTTAGTGSEVTIVAVVSDLAKQRKLPLMDPRLMPRAAALDGSLMTGVPADITAATGMDALTHAVESFISKNATARTDSLALEATQLIMANLATAVSDGSNIEARQALARAAYLAGKAFTQAGVGYVHAIAHNFGGIYHIAHGRANAIILPYVLAFSMPQCAQRLSTLAVACGVGSHQSDPESNAQQFIARICQMNRSFGIPETVAELKTTDIPRIAKAARQEARFTYAVPRYMSRAQCEDLVAQMLPAGA